MGDTMLGPVMTWKLDASVMKVSFFRENAELGSSRATVASRE
jgi:hypothetical protein